AEDGIRDRNVTGVQTCALPISVSKEKVCFFLMNVPNGIQKMSGEIEGLVETSTNLGIIKLGPSVLYGSSSVRSSVGSGKDALTRSEERRVGKESRERVESCEAR